MGAEFIAEEGVLKGLVLALEKGEEWKMGRDPDLCEIVLEDPQVSRLQLRIFKTDAGYFLENLDLANPILVGGELCTEPRLLQEAEEVTIGGTLFRFHREGLPAAYSFEMEGDAGEEKTPEEPEEEIEPEETFQQKDIEEEEFEAQEPISDEEIFEEPALEEAEAPYFNIDLTPTTRFILKVIAGPNTGAEFALDLDRSYLIGTDTVSCDIVFNDLSVSREHARLSVDADGKITIEDLGSRNGVIVDKERIAMPKVLLANAVVSLGTSAFLLIDREAPSETIAAPVFELPEEEKEPRAPEEEEEILEEPVHVKAPAKAPMPPGVLVLTLIICGLALLFGVGTVSLFRTKEVEMAPKDYLTELQNIIKKYPAVRFTYNQGSGKLFLMGHVKTGVEYNELIYQLKGLGFIKGIDDNVVNDEAVWQEMNILLSKHKDFKGISMHSPEAGVFVVAGYLDTEKQASDLTDYLNINFNYLSRLQNKVVVEQAVLDEVISQLIQHGFVAVNATLTNGDLQLTGYINSTELYTFEKLVDEFKKIPGVRSVRSFVIAITPEQSVVDLNQKRPIIPDLNQPGFPGLGIPGVYSLPSAPAMPGPAGPPGPPGPPGAPGATVAVPSPTLSVPGIPALSGRTTYRPRYRVTGYSKHGDVNINVVINGKIVGRGDCIDGYTITSIQPNVIFLEKDGLKYKIEYNTCKYFDMEE